LSISHDATTQIVEMRAVSSTIVIEMPSTPMKYSMLNDGIQGIFVTYCIFAVVRSKDW